MVGVWRDDDWYERIADAEKALSLDVGFKLLYGPWGSWVHAKTVCLTLNPTTKVPIGAPKRSVPRPRVF